MKRPAQRAQGKQTHLCSVCRSPGHRVNTCPHPAAARIRELQQQVQVLKKKQGCKQRVLRQETKNRKSPQDTSKSWKQKQQLLYSGRTTSRQASPAELRRKKPTNDLFGEALSSNESAVKWLLLHKFISKPSSCDSCGKKFFYEVFGCEERGPHWRCKCGARFPYLSKSLFCGLKMSAVLLVSLLRMYVNVDLTMQCKVPDLVRHCGCCKKQALHFVAVMREAEAHAGNAWAAAVRLKGDVEVDGTAFGRFYISTRASAFQQQIQNIQQTRREAGEHAAKAFVVTLQVLGAMERTGKTLLHLSGPRVPCPTSNCIKKTLHAHLQTFFFNKNLQPT